MEDVQDKLKQIREQSHRKDIFIACDTSDVKTRFKKLAMEQFKDDYELTLRWLLDCSEGYFAKHDDEISARIDLIADEVKKTLDRIDKLEAQPEQKRRMLNGRIV